MLGLVQQVLANPDAAGVHARAPALRWVSGCAAPLGVHRSGRQRQQVLPDLEAARSPRVGVLAQQPVDALVRTLHRASASARPRHMWYGAGPAGATAVSSGRQQQ